MAETVKGKVREKAYHPPPGAPDKYWCYVVVETESGPRLRVRLHQRVQEKILIGDTISFKKPRRKNKRVAAVRVG
jgi:hypothetical protein